MKCLRSIADTYHPEVLETTFPETLFSSLVELLRVTQHGMGGGGETGEGGGGGGNVA